MIPKIIHYCWFGGGSIPDKDKKCIESWKKYCPDFEIKLWNESNYDVTKNKYMHEAYQAKKWGFVPDFARLDIIYNYGGVYLDTDVEIIRSIGELCECHAFMGFEKSGCVALGLGFGAEKGNATIKVLMHSYDNMVFIGEDGKPILVASPKLNTDELVRLGLKMDGTYQILNNDVTVFPEDYFCPMDYEKMEMNITENTYTIHHYAASWMPEEEVKAHMNRIKYSRKYGEKKGLLVAKIVNIPIRLKYHIKEKGISGTIGFVLRKYILGVKK